MWWMVSVALGCAGLVHEEGQAAESSGAAVLLVDDGDAVEVHYEVVYAGDAETFGWLIPVPGEVLSVSDGDPNTFVQLSQSTAPSVTRVLSTESGKRGCGPAAKGDAAGANESVEPGGDLQVVAEGFTGTFAYTVLDAADPSALDGWFADQGWSPGVLSDDLAYYTDRGDAFVALTLSNEEGAEAPQQLPPLVLRYRSDMLSFPSVMARHAAEDQRVTLYVQGAGRAEVASGWVMEDGDDIDGPGDADAAEVLDDHLYRLGTQGAWMRTWSGPLDGAFVTRFDLYAPPEQHVEDAVFGFDGTDHRTSTVIWLEGGGAASAGWLALTLLGGLGWRRLRA